ncbi:MAG: oxygenase MpaB family protein [Vicinamibacterales bacterium]
MYELVSRRINAERCVLFGWSRAILLQLAHPLVAAGVAEHSSFHDGGFTAVVRLHHTIRAMLALAFGDERGRQAALDGIRAIHRRVHGRLPAAAGIFPAGTPYTAEDPDLVLWVHATLVESIPPVYELLVQPLTGEERDAYCVEAASIAVDLGARSDEVPRTWAATAAYLDRMYQSGAIAVSAQARELAALVVSPPFGRLVAPAAWANRLMTVGLLPDDIRRQFGLTWSARQARMLRSVTTILRSARRLTPNAVALWPEAKHVSSRGL